MNIKIGEDAWITEDADKWITINGAKVKLDENGNPIAGAEGNIPASINNSETGPFGKIFTDYKHDAKGAINKLMQEKDGEAVGALTHPEIGDIDLIWGSQGDPSKDYAGGYGLAKIAAKHPEAVNILQEILSEAKVKTKSDNRAILESEKYKAVVGLNWLKKEKKWLLSAYEKGSKVSTTIYTANDSAEMGGSPFLASLMIIEQLLSDNQAGIMANNNSIAMDNSVRHYDGNGHLIVEKTIISQAAINPYLGEEIPDSEKLGLNPKQVYYLLRDPAELLNALDTFKGIQLMIKHIPVNANESSKELTVGSIGTDVTMEGNDVVASLRVWDQEGIDLIESKKLQELSAGYAYTADMTSGEWNGEHYDGVMRNIHGNHVALVERGRIGRDAIIADHLPIEIMESKMKLKKGTAPKILDLLKRIAQDNEITEDTVEEVVKTVGDSLEEDVAEDEDNDKTKAKDNEEPDAKDEEPDKKAKDNEPPKSALDAAKIAADAENKAVARVTALFEARKEVEPLVGVVGMDSAESVYKHALTQSGVDINGVHPSAYKSMTQMLLKQKASSSFAMDSGFKEPDAGTAKLTSRFKK